jgi:DNA-binding NarL/FixJ family response regulator
MPDADLLTDAGHLLIQKGVEESIIEWVINELRQRYGGDRVFIPKIDRPTRNQRIAADLQQGIPHKQIARQRGCSPATVSRISREWTL